MSREAWGSDAVAGRCVLALLIDHEGVFLPGLVTKAQIRLDAAGIAWLAQRAGHPDDGLSRLASGPPDTVDELTSVIEARVGAAGFAPGAPEESDPWPVPPLDVYEGEHRMATPVAVGVSAAGFDILHHGGSLRLRLGGRELLALTSLAVPRTVAVAHEQQRLVLGPHALDDREFERLVAAAVGTQLVAPLATDPAHAAEGRATREFRRSIALQQRRAVSVDAALTDHRSREAEREAATGRVRVKVVPVNSEGNPILSLGLLMAHASTVDGGRLQEHYQFPPDWADKTVPQLTADDPPAVFLFSNYIWSHAWNVVRSAEVKERNPLSLTVHGGPNTPKYEADIQEFFRMNPQVDITVHGEGEATLVHLLDVVKDSMVTGRLDRSVLRDVPGISFRDGQEVVHTGPRERISDLDTLASPYDLGLFDSVGDNEITLMTIETNRGCPYGCTYCDWGSATLSRIRKFDLDRVYRELEWCARHKVGIIFNADANFGIFERDVDVARRLVELKKEYGYPRVFESSYAKNTVKHLREIIEILAEGEVLSTGTLSLQSVDPDTLDAIHRSNIRVEKYDDLAIEFGKQGLPLVIELMMGLPGSTMKSFLGDLQQCIDREVKARVNPTEVLMNSPMNEPTYKDLHQISTLRPVNQDWSEQNRTRRKALVVSTTTFSREEYELMERYRLMFLLCENFGVFRQVSRFVRQETGVEEVQLYVRMVDELLADRSRWPSLACLLDLVVDYMVPPVSWALVMMDLRDYLVTIHGVEDGSALDTVLAVQLALIPSRERAYPEQISLAHDYGAWHAKILAAKRAGHSRDWADQVPRLETFGPTTFTVDDPGSVSVLGLGMSLVYDPDSDWELASPVARPMRLRHSVHA